MKLLVVEDNADLAETIASFMVREGYVCEIASHYNVALDKLSGFTYDCIILDLMLPDGNGLGLLEWIKKSQRDTSVLIISAKNALDDKITGLEMGADDYLTKPFHLTELHARIKALYRRKKLNGEKLICWNEIVINPDTFEVRVHDTSLDLTRKEYDLLVYFLINKNRVLTRQSIAEHLWGDYTENLGNFDFVYQHVKNLRKKIEQAKGGDYISTVYGLGYKFEAKS